jgi:TolA-binding protein
LTAQRIRVLYYLAMGNKIVSSPATIADVNKAVKSTEKVLRVEILRVEERAENLEEGQKEMKVMLNKISNQLDGFVGRVDDLTNDNEIGTEQIHELKDITKDHEKRITKLESSN